MSETELLNGESLPPSSLWEGCVVSIRGWENDNEAEAREFGAGVMAQARLLSRYLDLSRLESIVIGIDYAEALASVDRGESLPSAAPTSNEYAEGGAMALHVLRDDELWSVVVIWTGLVRQLMDDQHPHHNLALQTFVHELVHVDDLRLFSRTYPGGWRAAKSRNGRDTVLIPIVHSLESEYSAQRRSAWAAPDHGIDLLDMLGRSMADVDEQIRSARLAYRVHGNMDIYWPIVTERLTFLFQSLGYALGHADWVASEAEEHAELAQHFETKLTELAQLPAGWLIKACREAVKPFFELEAWSDQSVFDPLLDVLEQLLNQHGMYTRAEGEGIHVDMPYTGWHDL
ncbi:hypothetical protein [Sinorhizobium fredii]|uniref:hypothetical protein n=1 Tax=Rhizobium fredii TaxID=380 RepID=UPI003514BD83